MRLPHVRVNAAFAAPNLFRLGTWTTDVRFWRLLVVVFPTACAGAQHRASDLCETLCFCKLFGDVWELARLGTLPEREILSASSVPINSHGRQHTRHAASSPVHKQAARDASKAI